eukprot:scaffold131785_cov48-Phaeocystis_antarctica.AAC.1
MVRVRVRVSAGDKVRVARSCRRPSPRAPASARCLRAHGGDIQVTRCLRAHRRRRSRRDRRRNRRRNRFRNRRRHRRSNRRRRNKRGVIGGYLLLAATECSRGATR